MAKHTHSDRAHARLSPSSASRWANCPGSVALSDLVPKTTTPAADEGTAAHMLAEWCFRHGREPVTRLGDTMAISNSKHIPIDEEMADGVKLYLDYIRDLQKRSDVVLAETQLDLSHISPGQFGTADFIAWDELIEELTIVDFKYGFAGVDPTENFQLMLYALGAVEKFKHLDLRSIRLVVVQPRQGGIKEWTTNPTDLSWVLDQLRGQAKRALEPDAPRNPGPWCVYCPGAAICPEHKAKALEAARVEFSDDGLITPDVTTFDREKLSQALKDLPILEGYVKSLKAFAMGEAKEGRMPPGWKLVATRPRRRWIDEERAQHALVMVGDLHIDQVAPRKLLSPAQIEKLIGRGKDAKNLLGDMVEKHSSGVRLVPENDPRPAVVADALSEFEAAEEE